MVQSDLSGGRLLPLGASVTAGAGKGREVSRVLEQLMLLVSFIPYLILYSALVYRLKRQVLDADRLKHTELLARSDQGAGYLRMPVDLLGLLVVMHE